MRVYAVMIRARSFTALAGLLLWGTAWAADPSPPSKFHAEGGPAFFVATQTGREPWDLGYAVGAGIDAGIALGMSATFDIDYAHFGPDDSGLMGRVGDHLTVGGTSTASDAEAKLLTVLIGGKYQYRPAAQKLNSPYVKIAAGLGHFSYGGAGAPPGDGGTARAGRSVSRLAVAAAAGIEIRPRWLPLGLLVETQYVYLFTEEVRAQYVPVRAGVTLGL
jgi:hypothetical protein